MSLLTRLISPQEGEQKLPVHQFMAGLAEYKRGVISGAQLVNAFNLTSEETSQLQSFLNRVDDNSITREQVHDVLMLGEGKYYTTQQVADRLL